MADFFNNRTSGYSDEYGFSLEAGADILEMFFVKADMKNLISTQNGDLISPEQLYSTFLNNTEYFAYGIEAGWKFLPPLGLSIGGDFAAGGENILAGPTIFGSIYANF